ncbi:hypothetical protein OH76DRAFT_1397576 [Lentinus brumalis]|uniref:Protein kinase domain-containing protein n=1 Tax=Lentinus brumalis TaxID=2498619 RepID=A0A371DRR5_9APHY|nr:hypothetical protein OH76DRAFT_1397576 [Polyporus brumalis]
MSQGSLGVSEMTPPNIPCDRVEHFRDLDGLDQFWLSIDLWLAHRGVKIYDMRVPEPTPTNRCPVEAWCTPSVSTAAPLPFARCLQMDQTPSRFFQTPPRLACGQDSLGRDVMLKLVDTDSHQYRIFETLLRQLDSFSNSRNFPCVLPPLAIIDAPQNYAVVSMPLWGSPVYITDMRTVRQVLRFMECLIRGLKFLHDNRIAHRDIWEHNIVVDCYRPDQSREHLREDLCRLRDSGDVLYALMDYDQSIQHPANASLKEFRRPADEAMCGSTMYRPYDVCLGEPDYNPFAFDVAMLGNLFRAHFVEAVPAVPALAALYDGMTTHVLSQRFTAQEAWQFFDTQVVNLPLDVLETTVQPSINWSARVDPDVYWSTLSPELQASWGHFRAPPCSIWSDLLNWFIGFPRCCQLIVFTRRVLGI